MSLGQVYEHDGITVSKKVSGDMGTMALTETLLPSSPENRRKCAQKACNPEGSHLISHDITSLVPTHLNAIPSTTSQSLFLEYSANTNRLRIMLSPISDYCSELKKQYHDDLLDYDRGTLDGNASAHLAWFIVSITPVLFGV